MDHGTELKALYQQAIGLSEQQGQAIEQADWPQLQALLDKREGLIQQAEHLLAQAHKPSNKQELSSLLLQLQQIDERNQELLAQKRQALRTEMDGLERSKSALNGYLDSFGGANAPTFFDQDR